MPTGYFKTATPASEHQQACALELVATNTPRFVTSSFVIIFMFIFVTVPLVAILWVKI
jgi:hypothetical protein